jgi:hypothetical protein
MTGELLFGFLGLGDRLLRGRSLEGEMPEEDGKMTRPNHELLGRRFKIRVSQKVVTVISVAGAGWRDQVTMRGPGGALWIDEAWRVWADIRAGRLEEV